MSKKNMDELLKEAMQSRPEGSFLFPSNVVVEDLLEHIDDTWNSLWEGGPSHSSQNSSLGCSSIAEEKSSQGTTPKRQSWLKKTLVSITPWGRKEKDNMIGRTCSINRLQSFVPRFPSWVEWNDELENRKKSVIDAKSKK